MANGWTHVFLLCWFSFLFLTGLNLFSRGFLLRRVVLNETSSCKSNGAGRQLDALNLSWTMNEVLDEKSNCWLPSRYSKAVILIIDGLRFDFVAYNESLADSDALPFQNKLRLVHQLMKEQPLNSALFRFLADPPTTTMQRIKGLITGSLPTFIDVSDNFASYEIKEDSIVHQLVAQDRRITFLGDDTWIGLVPNKFKRSYPFPSFNVKDLHTVDNGIVEHLVPEIGRKDWDVLVAHFLGVDHCGHRYGPYHMAMADKLKQMNEVLRSVIDSLNSDTILFVMGDHGMTKSGDHGGDSTDEVSSALFVYSKKRLQHSMDSTPVEINQVDFVPTFSLLMGIPIPFGNLGRAIGRFFTQMDHTKIRYGREMDESFSALALYFNAKQVQSYLNRYNSFSNELVQDRESFSELEQLLADAENMWSLFPSLPSVSIPETLSSIQMKCTKYLTLARNICQKVWAQFDSLSMITGLCIFAASLVLASGQVFLRLQVGQKSTVGLFVFALVGGVLQIHSSISVLNFIQGMESFLAIVIVVASGLLYVSCAWRKTSSDAAIGQDRATSCKVVFLCGISSFSFLFSNSFVVNEASLSSYILISILWWEVLSSSVSKSSSHETERKSKSEILPRSRVLCLMFALLSTICIRTASMFWKCREEQWWCEGSNWLRSLANVPADTVERVSYKNWRFFVSMCSVAAIVFAVRWFMRKAGNANGFAPAVLCASYVPAFMGIAICIYWALQGMSSTVIEPALLVHQVHVPNAVFLVAILGIIIIFLRPLCIYSVRDEVAEIGPIASSDTRQVFRQVYCHLKANWKDYFSSARIIDGSNNRPLMVYGLASVFSASFIVIGTILMLVFILLSSDGLAPAFLLLFITEASILYCLASSRGDLLSNNNCILKVPWSWVLLWSFLASVGFYATGHQQTFPALYWESATIGSDDHLGFHVVPAAKILLNTFSSSVLAGIGLPLLLLWPFTSHVLFHKHNQFSTNAADELKKGEFYLFQNPALFEGLFLLICKYFIMQGAKLFVSMAAAALLRRHLMVWKIFAPRFLFEAVNFCITIPAVLCGFLLVMSIHNAVTSWIEKLEQHAHSS